MYSPVNPVYTAFCTHNRSSPRQYSSDSAFSDIILFADCFAAVLTRCQRWFASFLKENSSKCFHRPFCLSRFYANALSTAKSATVPLKRSPSSTFSFCLNLPYSVSYNLWPVVPSHKVPHWSCTPDPVGEPHDDILTLFFSPAVLPSTSFRLLLLDGQVIYVFIVMGTESFLACCVYLGGFCRSLLYF